MSYLTPASYVCPICKFEWEWSPSMDKLGLGQPFCPCCYCEFIAANVPWGVLKNKSKFTPGEG